MARNTETASSPSVRLYLLGTFRLERESPSSAQSRDGRPIGLPTRKVESLLAYLALHREAHAREKLAALLWGDSPDTQARTSFRVALNALRKHLSDQLLLAEHNTIQLHPDFPLWVDALAFETIAKRSSAAASSDWQAAVALYHGDLLTDFYDDWVLPLREHYRNLYLDLLLRLAREMRARSEYEHAIAYAEQVLVADVGNEQAYQNLMFCYVAKGERNTALEQYDECRRVLHDELGVEPMRETTALYHWIKQTPSQSRAHDALPTNLPIPLTSFIGRTPEMAEVKQWLTTTRLLTLTGAGGCGKTRLAIQMATDLIDAFRDGVWWVELAALADAALVPYAVAKALGVREAPNQSLTETLVDYLHAKQLLLLLDNCEHLVDACATLIAQLLQACPHLKILTTSRETLGLTGETIWRVPSLALPPISAEYRVLSPEPSTIAQDLMQYEAIRLFVERAAAVNRDVALTEHNASTILQLCRRLDGIPLALELAAARVKVLSLEQIAVRLDDRFNLLTIGSRAALPRQQTLRATVDWSYDLLEAEEKILLRRVSVFAGGFVLDAAEFVCDFNVEIFERSNVLDLLTHLVDKSLVSVEPFGEQMRYQMLETIRQYAQDKLRLSDEHEATSRRHFEWYLRLAQAAEPHLVGAEQAQWFEQIEAELDNVRAALSWALSRSQSASDAELREAAMQLAVALGQFWYVRGHFSEGRRWLERLLNDRDHAISKRTLTRANALYRQGFLAWHQADYTAAHTLFEESRIVSEELGDKVGMALSLQNQGLVLTRQGDHAAARRLLEQSIALQREVGDQTGMTASLFIAGRVAWFQDDLVAARALLEQGLTMAQATGNLFLRSLALSTLGDVAWSEGNYALARAQVTEALANFRTLGNPQNTATALVSLGYVSWSEGDHAAAHALYTESLALYKEVGDKWGIASALEGFACLAVAEEEIERAIHLFAAANRMRIAFGAPQPIFRAAYERSMADARAALGEEAFAKAWAEGEALSIDSVVDYAIGKATSERTTT